MPDLRAFQGFAEAFCELPGIGEMAFGVVAVACAEPGSSQRVQALQDAAGVGDFAPQPERLTVMVLGCGPVVLGLGDSAEVGEDRAWITRSRSASGRRSRSSSASPEPCLGGLDVAAEVFGGGHDAVTAGAQVGIRDAGKVESRTSVALRFAEVAEVQRDIR